MFSVNSELGSGWGLGSRPVGGSVSRFPGQAVGMWPRWGQQFMHGTFLRLEVAANITYLPPISLSGSHILKESEGWRPASRCPLRGGLSSEGGSSRPGKPCPEHRRTMRCVAHPARPRGMCAQRPAPLQPRRPRRWGSARQLSKMLMNNTLNTPALGSQSALLAPSPALPRAGSAWGSRGSRKRPRASASPPPHIAPPGVWSFS